MPRTTLSLFALSGLLCACSPTLNWRDVDVGPQTRAQFPCKPEHAERTLPLDGTPMRAAMWVCDAGGVSWSATVLEVGDPARLETVLRASRLGLAQRLLNEAPGKTLLVKAGDRTLPLCSYPTYPKFVSGPAESATSYQCTAP